MWYKKEMWRKKMGKKECVSIKKYWRDDSNHIIKDDQTKS